MKVQAVFHFLPTPKEYRGRAVLMELDGETLKVLRKFIEGHEKEAYRAEFTPQNIRSLPANARFHAILTRYAAHVGLSMDDAKIQIKHAYGVAIPYIDGFIPPMREGVFVELYGMIEYQISTSVYTKAEMCRLMDGLEMACAEAGIVISA